MNFKCQECGKDFEPDPDTMMECHVSAEWADEDGEEWKGQSEPMEMTPEMREQAKKQLGCDDEQLDRLLSGEEVVCGALCICKECQDRMHEEQHGYRPDAPRA